MGQSHSTETAINEKGYVVKVPRASASTISKLQLIPPSQDPKDSGFYGQNQDPAPASSDPNGQSPVPRTSTIYEINPIPRTSKAKEPNQSPKISLGPPNSEDKTIPTPASDSSSDSEPPYLPAKTSAGTNRKVSAEQPAATATAEDPGGTVSSDSAQPAAPPVASAPPDAKKAPRKSAAPKPKKSLCCRVMNFKHRRLGRNALGNKKPKTSSPQKPPPDKNPTDPLIVPKLASSPEPKVSVQIQPPSPTLSQLAIHPPESEPDDGNNNQKPAPAVHASDSSTATSVDSNQKPPTSTVKPKSKPRTKKSGEPSKPKPTARSKPPLPATKPKPAPRNSAKTPPKSAPKSQPPARKFTRPTKPVAQPQPKPVQPAKPTPRPRAHTAGPIRPPPKKTYKANHLIRVEDSEDSGSDDSDASEPVPGKISSRRPPQLHFKPPTNRNSYQGFQTFGDLPRFYESKYFYDFELDEITQKRIAEAALKPKKQKDASQRCGNNFCSGCGSCGSDCQCECGLTNGDVAQQRSMDTSDKSILHHRAAAFRSPFSGQLSPPPNRPLMKPMYQCQPPFNCRSSSRSSTAVYFAGIPHTYHGGATSQRYINCTGTICSCKRPQMPTPIYHQYMSGMDESCRNC